MYFYRIFYKTFSSFSNRHTLYIKNNTNLSTKTISNGFLGKTITGTLTLNSGETATAPTGCYIIGGYKQGDGNFNRFDYACP